jgi:hypothetical protein
LHLQAQGDDLVLPVTLPKAETTGQVTTAVRIHTPNDFAIELKLQHSACDLERLVTILARL